MDFWRGGDSWAWLEALDDRWNLMERLVSRPRLALPDDDDDSPEGEEEYIVTEYLWNMK